jgi:hypothetical protein
MNSRNPQKADIISFSEGHVLLAVIHTVFFVPFHGPLFHVNVCICLQFRTKLLLMKYIKSIWSLIIQNTHLL